MILTVTPNPSLDRTYEVPALTRGTLHRATADRVEPGGKGVNVSRAVAAAGGRTIAVLPLGGAPGALVGELLGAQGIDVTAVSIAGNTRSNIAVVEPDATLTKINALGPELTPTEAALLLDSVRAQAPAADWIACCGSLPRGLPQEWYADLIAVAHDAGARVALDTSGPALLAALPAGPDLVKPNAAELAEAVGRPLATVGEAAQAARELRHRGARAVLASLGAAGQLLVDATGTYYGYARVDAVRSVVGAGDAALAGFLLATAAPAAGTAAPAAGTAAPAAGTAAPAAATEATAATDADAVAGTDAGPTGPGPGSDPAAALASALASALAHGAAAVGLPGSAMPTPADLDPSAVTVVTPPDDIPADRPLDH
ncbi:1-phosphofructokinase [Streptomyces sp. NRRL S-87]|uniref:1-phosphofructokinase n=1 Tax=Streptomyces sp. NRRL S-87 TaxID=1463920 RepID=UPI00055F2697|nr:1-phosphofructokinase [Streptomyces sp. NRRL S-87]